MNEEGHRATRGTFWDKLARAEDDYDREKRYKQEHEDSIKRLQDKYPERSYQQRNNIGRRVFDEG